MGEVITLDMSAPSVQYLCKRDKRLAKLISMVGPITYMPHTTDSYSFLVHEIIEQMLSVKSGKKIYGRLKALCNGEITPERINSLNSEELRSIGTSSAKADYILALTTAVLSGDLVFEKLTSISDDNAIKELTKVRGIGMWTAKMYLLFVLDRPDILPFEDGAFLQTYRWVYKTDDCRKESIYKRCKKWKPYSSVASRFFYRALDAGLTKEDFHLFK